VSNFQVSVPRFKFYDRQYVGVGTEVNRQSAQSTPTQVKTSSQSGLHAFATWRKTRHTILTTDQLTQLVGETRHISENGLALIMRGFRMDDLYLSQTVCITLELPSAPIRLRGTPVRLERLDRGIEDRSLICVRITEMDRRDRARYNRYLRRLRLLAPNLAPLLTAGQALE